VTSSLKSLLSLNVDQCAQLQSLGALQFLASLKELYITICPKLEEIGGRDVSGKLPTGNSSLHFLVLALSEVHFYTYILIYYALAINNSFQI
jgi:hypothetical protein